MKKMAESDSCRVKELSLSNIFLSGLSLPLEVFTSSVKHLQKLELLNCDMSSAQCDALFRSLSSGETLLKELNLTNTKILQLDPQLLAQCSLGLEKICLSDLTENQTSQILKSLSLAKSYRLKAVRLEGVTEYDNWSEEGGYLCNAVSKLEKFSIKFKQSLCTTSLRTRSFRLFLEFLSLNDRKSLEEISIHDGRFSSVCGQGMTGNSYFQNVKVFFEEPSWDHQRFSTLLSRLRCLSLVGSQLATSDLWTLLQVRTVYSVSSLHISNPGFLERKDITDVFGSFL